MPGFQYFFSDEKVISFINLFFLKETGDITTAEVIRYKLKINDSAG